MKAIAIAALLGLAAPALAASQAPAPFPEGYLDANGLGASLKRLAEAYPRSVRVAPLGKSLRGRDLWLVTLGHADPASGERRPTILLVANLEADHVVGSQVALGIVERLAAADGRDAEVAKLLDRCTILVVPRLNPDGVERLLKGPRSDFRTNLRAMDRDRDGRANEDGPDDLDGDGLITRMRVRDDQANLMSDDKDPRLARRPSANKGEKAAFREFSEGIDDDDDGRVNEDPDGGVDLNRNWPHRWTEFDPEAGAEPAGEPEVRALIKYAFDHPEIAAAWSFGLNDNLKAAATTPDDADKPIFAELTRLYGKALAAKPEKPPEAEPPAAKPDAARPVATQTVTRVRLQARPGGPRGGPRPPANEGNQGAPPAIEGTTDGAFAEWAYHQFGVVGLASRLWSTPEIPEPAKGQPAPPAEGDARWLYWNDHVMNGRAFVPFAPFDHPTLGKVEIGGWKPGVRLNPPADRIDALAEVHAAFLKDLASRLPEIALSDPKVEAKGGGVFQVTATVRNDGYLPTALVMGVRTRKAAPVLVRLKLGEAKLLAGRAQNRIDALAGSGGRQEFRWLVLAPNGGTITLEATSPKAGRASKAVELK